MIEQFEDGLNIAQIIIEKSKYEEIVLKRGIFDYLAKSYIDISDNNNDYIIKIECKNDSDDIRKIVKDIKNSIYEEDIRYKIECETNSIRNLLYEKARRE